MAAQSVASRSSRPNKNAVDDDVVMARAIQFSQWARQNIRLVVGGAIVALLVVGGLLYYRMYQADRMERAATEFVAVQQTAASGNLALAARDIEQYINRFEGTTYAAEARILLGELQLREGQTAQAVATLGAFGAGIDDSPVGAQGALLLAAAQQAAGNTEDAIATYLMVAEESEIDFRQETALTNAATLREQAGDFAGAAELYARLVETAEEGSLERSLYEMRRTEAEARAQAR